MIHHPGVAAPIKNSEESILFGYSFAVLSLMNGLVYVVDQSERGGGEKNEMMDTQ